MEYEIKVLELVFENQADSKTNEIQYWKASAFLKLLGYPNLTSFMKPIQRAMQACLAANIDTHENFIKTNTQNESGEITSDYLLTRFACYMISMNADSKKPEVANSQVFFAKQAEKIQIILEGKNDIDRLHARSEVKDGTKALTAAAKAAGVSNYGMFMDAGYRGLYNRSIDNVKELKGVSKTHNLFDYMGRTELAANLFRITLTEERLKNERVNNERNANFVHQSVGKEVRSMVISNTGKTPEGLPVERRITEVTKELKKANKKLNKKK